MVKDRANPPKFDKTDKIHEKQIHTISITRNKKVIHSKKKHKKRG